MSSLNPFVVTYCRSTPVLGWNTWRVSHGIHARTQLPRAAENVNIPFCATQWSLACVLRDVGWIQSPYSTKHVLCTMTHCSLKWEVCHQYVWSLRKCLSFQQGPGVRLNKYPDAKIRFVAKLKIMWQWDLTLFVKPHLYILEDKSFLYIAEMYICTIIQAFEDGHNLQAIVAVFSSLGGNEPGLTGVSEGLNNK